MMSDVPLPQCCVKSFNAEKYSGKWRDLMPHKEQWKIHNSNDQENEIMHTIVQCLLFSFIKEVDTSGAPKARNRSWLLKTIMGISLHDSSSYWINQGWFFAFLRRKRQMEEEI